MLGTIVLIVLQLGANYWLVNRALNTELATKLQGPLKIAFAVVLSSIIAWIIGIIASEIIKDVIKPTPNAFLSSLFVATLLVCLLIIPLFSEFIVPLKDMLVPAFHVFDFAMIGAVIGYHFSK